MDKREQKVGGQKAGGSHSYSRNTRQNRIGSADKCREQDRFMPIANVIRIMRRVIPADAKISDDVKETILKCVSEFMSSVTSEANLRCHGDSRKTITAEDLLWGMSNLGLEDYLEPLAIYLKRFRENDEHPSGDAQPQSISTEHGTMGVTNAFTPAMGIANAFPPAITPTMGITNTFTPGITGITNAITPTMGITNAFTPTMGITNAFTPAITGITNAFTPAITPAMGAFIPAMNITNAFTPGITPTMDFTNAFTPAMYITNAFTPAITPTMGFTNAFTPEMGITNAFAPTYYMGPWLPGVMTMEDFLKYAQNGGSTSGAGGAGGVNSAP